MKVMEIRTESGLDVTTVEGVRYGNNTMKSSINVNGKVWVGDPCYPPTFNSHWVDEEFNRIGWLKAFSQAEKELEDEESYAGSIVVLVNDMEMVAGSTAEGDGTFEVTGYGGEIGVDAGLLCVIPEEMFEVAGLDGEEGHGGLYLENVSGTAEVDEDGTLCIGNDYKVITKAKCENCGAIEGECSCERCWGCGQWEDWCECESTCCMCNELESECVCDEEEEED